METYERVFVSKMRETMKDGAEFEKVCRKALAKVLGETPSEVFRAMIGDELLRRPGSFAVEISSIFGEGARPLLASIEDYAMEWSRAGGESKSKSTHESLLENLPPPGDNNGAEAELNPLHDPRIKDDLDTYADDAG